MLYITYFPFYTASGDSCWDKCGIIMHTIAAILIFFVLPIVCAAVAVVDIVRDLENYYRPHTSIHMVVLVCMIGDIVVGLTAVRRIVMRTWEWHKIRKGKVLI